MSDNKSNYSVEGLTKLKSLVEEISICLFCTNLKTNDGATTRPMSVAQVSDQGNLWFFNQKDSENYKEIQQDSKVQLFFAHPGKGSYMVVNGDARISTNPGKIEELWKPSVEIWYERGKGDPNISLIEVTLLSAYFWDTEGNTMINLLKEATSYVTGTNLINGTEGDIVI